jgi:hypothetical protein
MTDARVTEGRVVEVLSERLRGSPAWKELLFVALDDDEEAEKIARKYAGETIGPKVRSLGRLDPKNVAKLGMNHAGFAGGSNS